ncbi:MAG TPA: hypothetical protein VL327_05880 [Pyrinomonadaceae bacterium]|nr:hypothetical protein [Pyrinomonadaceae bacterium]
MKTIFFVLLMFCFSLGVLGQTIAKVKPEDAAVSSSANAAVELSKAALAAHGGDKLKAIKTLIVRGTADVTMSSFNQAFPAGFAIVISGERYRLDIQSQFQSLKQVYDGKETFSSIPGFSLPPVTSLGFPVLLHIGDTGYVVSALPETGKKKGFRVTTREGFYTDFFVDEKTGQVKGYESSYDLNGRTITTSVVIDKYRIVDGVTVPEKYSQRFDLGQMTAYADFKAKEILINSPVADDVFTIGK